MTVLVLVILTKILILASLTQLLGSSMDHRPQGHATSTEGVEWYLELLLF